MSAPISILLLSFSSLIRLCTLGSSFNKNNTPAQLYIDQISITQYDSMTGWHRKMSKQQALDSILSFMKCSYMYISWMNNDKPSYLTSFLTMTSWSCLPVTPPTPRSSSSGLGVKSWSGSVDWWTKNSAWRSSSMPWSSQAVSWRYMTQWQAKRTLRERQGRERKCLLQPCRS